LFIYYTFVPVGTEARTEVKNKQGCGLARKGHGNRKNESIKVLETRVIVK